MPMLFHSLRFFFFHDIFFSVPYYSRFHHTTLILTNVLDRFSLLMHFCYWSFNYDTLIIDFIDHIDISPGFCMVEFTPCTSNLLMAQPI